MVRCGKVEYIKKKANAYISPIREAAPSQPIPTNLGLSSEVTDVVSYGKFHVDRFRAFCLAGTRISLVSIGKQIRPQHCA
jgi:hypothetical protein